MHASQPSKRSVISQILVYFWIAFGAFLAAFALEVFFIPNNLIDGGIVGVAMILGNVFGQSLIPYLLIILNLPFLVLAYRSIGKVFVAHMLMATFLFAASMIFINNMMHIQFKGDSLEVVVIGGAILGIGLGLIIREGGCLDGTEILGIIINRKTGFTVGQVVLVCNIFVFGVAGFVFKDWHPPLMSLITYIVVIKIMDSVIVGLDETKSVLIISSKSKAIADAIVHELGLGLTIMYGRGGFSGDEREILYVIAERLQLAELKDLILREDSNAFIAIENLHEVANGKSHHGEGQVKQTRMERIFSRILQKTNIKEAK
ncbi:conserved putative membrane protein [Candidatus Protochlamydia naegleriophila]|uniref:Conserved putative membrane protein n=1 Tax=Candidatus Protochlamydia naegleriophila TaxID=389348 RepID=A0A0U5JF00_9BACT|nr:YitT family protein [Candidatus Protochlamydia naegleriophila]CUI16959.1 conserved putative membrane protein [Candidatus Protochlamydia naegleriophila]